MPDVGALGWRSRSGGLHTLNPSRGVSVVQNFLVLRVERWQFFQGLW